jgi:hypothetical protein
VGVEGHCVLLDDEDSYRCLCRQNRQSYPASATWCGLRSAVFVLEAIAYFGMMKASVHHSPEARRVGNLVGGIIPEVVGVPQGWG